MMMYLMHTGLLLGGCFLYYTFVALDAAVQRRGPGAGTARSAAGPQCTVVRAGSAGRSGACPSNSARTRARAHLGQCFRVHPGTGPCSDARPDAYARYRGFLRNRSNGGAHSNH